MSLRARGDKTGSCPALHGVSLKAAFFGVVGVEGVEGVGRGNPALNSSGFTHTVTAVPSLI